MLSKGGIIMPINPDTQVSASVVLDKNVYNSLREIARAQRRSVSSLIALLIDDYLKEEGK
jgi:predicted DNA-binding ribbon-helix-helix protein